MTSRTLTEHERRLLERRRAVVDVVQVGMAHAAAGDTDEDLARSGLGRGDLLDEHRLVGAVEHRRFHVRPLV